MYWSFRFSISPSNEYSGLISFRIDWFDILSVQGILKSLLQHHSSKASILRCSALFTVQLSHPYMTTVCNRSLRVPILSLASINIKNPEQLLCYIPQLPPWCLIIFYVKLNVKCKLNIATRSTLTLLKSN